LRYWRGQGLADIDVTAKNDGVQWIRMRGHELPHDDATIPKAAGSDHEPCPVDARSDGTPIERCDASTDRFEAIA